MPQTNRLLLVAGICAALLTHSGALASDNLTKGFSNPPQSAHPQTWWHWMNGNVTKEGIKADLEAMHRVGIVEANIITVANDIPHGPVPVMSPAFFDDVEYAAQEANRLGMTLCMDNCPGWSNSGGPWIKPEQSMMMVVTSQTQVNGGSERDLSLAQPPTERDFYRDIAVLAFPTPVGNGSVPLEALAAHVTSNAPDFDASAFVKGTSEAKLPVVQGHGPQYIQMDFPSPVTMQTITITPGRANRSCFGEIQISDDGGAFNSISKFRFNGSSGNPVVIGLTHQVRSEHVRLVFTRTADRATGIYVRKIEFSSGLRVEDLARQAVYDAGGPDPLDVIKLMRQPYTPNMVVRSDKMIDLTASMKPDGSLTWSAPPGNWIIMRVGYTTTGVTNHPAPPEATGLECDKLSRAGLDACWNGMMQPIIDRLGPLAPKVLDDCLIDSYEVGGQNWTPKMAEDFHKLRGYDIHKYLPVFAGYVVDSPAVTERFLWDLRRTVSDLFAENYFGYFTDLCHTHGMKSMVEPYTGPFDSMECGASVDIPMGEFWTGSQGEASVHMAASVGHIYGQKIIAAESFTGAPEHGAWKEDPYSLKQLGDLAFSQGINRFVFHRYAHQPWMNRFPGMTMGQWGINLERTNTWFALAKPWMTYISRCQYLLQRGMYVADVAYYSGESAPVVDRLDNPTLPKGYACDAIDTGALLKLAEVQDGRLKLPDGESYRVLVLPSGDPEMTPDLLKKIRGFVKNGLCVVVGARPQHSPSLSNYPASEDQVKQLVNDLWGDCDGKSVTEHTLGKGKLVWGKPLNEVLASLNVSPDMEFDSSAPLLFIHRTSADADWYFVANHSDKPLQTSVTFRVSGKQPEFWWPGSGVMENAPVFSETDGRTTVPVSLNPAGSVFVVFRSQPAADHLVSVRIDSQLSQNMSKPSSLYELTTSDDGKTALLLAHQSAQLDFTTASGKHLHIDAPAPQISSLQGPWKLDFPPNWGAPPSITLDHLISWSDSSDKGVRYFSGTATYSKDIDIPASELGPGKVLILNLGDVKNLAQVKLNGKDLGILWKPPFRVDLAPAAHAGTNHLEIAITNLWPNRIIGDLQLPDDIQWSGNKPAAWPQWLLDGKSSPTGRLTFYTWRHLSPGDPLLPSGLIGPVTLEASKWIPVTQSNR
ncbi:MAG TPA: glycosyl hydrolase [Tepidisphaeraceae bacterium]